FVHPQRRSKHACMEPLRLRVTRENEQLRCPGPLETRCPGSLVQARPIDESRACQVNETKRYPGAREPRIAHVFRLQGKSGTHGGQIDMLARPFNFAVERKAREGLVAIELDVDPYRTDILLEDLHPRTTAQPRQHRRCTDSWVPCEGKLCVRREDADSCCKRRIAGR